MSDELRAPLVRAFQRLADDLAVERHGDPHVAFAVLVYPDREPAIIAITASQSGAHNLTILTTKDDDDAEDESEGPQHRFFTLDDLGVASNALNDAETGSRMFSFGRGKFGRSNKWGEYIGEEIREKWLRRRDYATEALLKKAADEAARPAECQYCHQRFTERGISMHLRKSAVCSRRHLDASNESVAADATQDGDA